MRLYFDLEKGYFVTAPGIATRVSRVNFKRGDAASVEVCFYRGITGVLLAGAPELSFMIKEAGKYDATPLVSSQDWQLATVAGDPYTCSPDFNTTALNALLNSGDGDDSNDVAYVDVMLEVSWTEDMGATYQSSNTITARIDNDVIKGNEGFPTSGAPAYPPAQAVQDAIVITAPVAASAVLSVDGKPAKDDTFTINGVSAQWVSTATSSKDNAISYNGYGTTPPPAADCARLIANLINGEPSSVVGVEFLNLVPFPDVHATLSGTDVTVTYDDYGVAGNSVAVAETMTNSSWSSATLEGGVEGEYLKSSDITSLSQLHEIYTLSGAVVDVLKSSTIRANVGVVNLRGVADFTLSLSQLVANQVIVINHLGFGHVTIAGLGGLVLTPEAGKRLAADGYGSQIVVSVTSPTAAAVSGDLQVADDVYDLAEPDIDLDSSTNFQARPASSGDVYTVNPRKGSALIERVQPDSEAINAHNFTRLVEEDGWDAPLFDTRKSGVNYGVYTGIEMVLKNPMSGPFTILFVGVSRYANVRKHVSHRIAGVDSPLIGAGGAYASPNDDKYQWLINSTDGNLGSYVIGNVVPPAGFGALEAPPNPMIVGGVFDGASSELWVNGVLMKSGTLSENILNEIIVGGAASPLCRRLLVWHSNQATNLTAITAALLNQHSNIPSYVA